MQPKNFVRSLFAVSLTVGGLTLGSMPNVQASPVESATNTTVDASSTVLAGSWIDAGGEEEFVRAELKSGLTARIFHGTTFTMICWYDGDPLGRRIYGQFTSGRYEDHYGNIYAKFVRNQVSTPHCD